MNTLECTAVLFDMDGTLLNTLDDLAEACNYALRKMGYPTHPNEAYKRFVGNGAKVLIQRILPKEALNEAVAEQARAIFDEYYQAHQFDNTRPYPGIPELLETLKQANMKLGVVSNKPDEFVQKIAAYYFPDIFDAVAGQQGQQTKPDPAGIQKVMEELQLTAGEVLYVGDSGVDIETAHNAHIYDCGVSWGFRGAEELKQYGAAQIADKPEDILRLLGIC